MIFGFLGMGLVSPMPGLGITLLIVGAMFTAAVGVSVFSFYLDDYWGDESFREELRVGSSKKRNKNLEKA